MASFAFVAVGRGGCYNTPVNFVVCVAVLERPDVF